jgi:hypothetical protein
MLFSGRAGVSVPAHQPKQSDLGLVHLAVRVEPTARELFDLFVVRGTAGYRERGPGGRKL